MKTFHALMFSLALMFSVGCHPQPVPPSDGAPVVTPSSWTDTAHRVVDVLHVGLPVASTVAQLVIPAPAGPVIARALGYVSTTTLPAFERGLAGYEARTGAGCSELSAATVLLKESLVGVAQACADMGFALPVDIAAIAPDVASIIDVLGGVCPVGDAGVASIELRARLRGIVGAAAARGVILRPYPALPPGVDAGVQ